MSNIWSIKNEMLFLKASCTLCNLKTDKQYDTKRELYSHEFIMSVKLAA